MIFIPLQGERGDRKAVGEGSLFNPIDFDGTPRIEPLPLRDFTRKVDGAYFRISKTSTWCSGGR